MTSDAVLPPIREEIQNLAGKAVFEIIEWGVFEWHPLPNGQGDPTQVHFKLVIDDQLPPFIMRIKSRKAAEQLMEAIRRHADNVWPTEEQ